MKKNKEMTIAFLGVGIMGAGMIKNLQKAGYRLNIYNRTISKAKKIATLNDKICANPTEAAMDADIIFSSVSDDKASKEVWFGKNGATSKIRNGTIVIETSTLSIPYIDAWIKKMKIMKLRAVDCPVTGSKLGAETATLSLFVGTDKKTLKELTPVFNTISTQIFDFGGNGKGMRFKLIYNMLGSVILVGFAEAMGLSQSFGLNMDEVVKILAANKQGWSRGVADSKGKNIINKAHSNVSCSLDTLTKDISYAIESAQHFNKTLPVSQSTAETMKNACKNGKGKLDMSAVGDLFLN